ncbi:nitrile hydratase accessory protein [Parasulfitobacter algicola]|uniref:Nitrile hydratase accessory protein n=1 Tax=Parasulfitobacter algicola TaxID=2614809 RepID=A0ABX2IMP9_9RHOB|nr:nitrile hydratase accessory protein [Sulfitobacter algicola]NSX54164.1 nitrile hydratase accessory protein [Sulfitobacter algicola]
MQPDPRPFDEPWQAQAFGLVVHLHERGLFSWTEWAGTLSNVIAAEQSDTPTNAEYYRCWLTALEQILAQKKIATPDLIDITTQAWHRAAHATPHGQPIMLESDPKRIEVK